MVLSKAALERHCTPLSDSTAKKNRGGHNVQEFAGILSFDIVVKGFMDTLKTELRGKPAVEQKRIINRLLELDSLKPEEVEATRRVYHELFREQPKKMKGEKKRWFPEYP